MTRRRIAITELAARRKGFTMIELMIVVVIIGILAAIAVSAYSKWIASARLSEAQSMAADIRTKQEGYFNTWGQYLNIPTFHPTTLPVDGKASWGTIPDPWLELGVAPTTGGTYFQYAVFASPAGGGGTPPPALGLNTANDWFYVDARGDLDGNTTNDPTQVIVTSRNSNAIINNEGQ